MTPTKTDGSEPLKGRQETFCQLYAGGKMSASEAYRQAGYSTKNADVNSANLMVKASIRPRIAYIKAEWARKHEITREGQSIKADKAFTIAEGQDNSTGMVAALVCQNRLYGLDKQVVETHKDQPLTHTEQQEADEWAAFTLWREQHGTDATGTGADGDSASVPCQLANASDPTNGGDEGDEGTGDDTGRVVGIRDEAKTPKGRGVAI